MAQIKSSNELFVGPFLLGSFISQSQTHTVLEGTHLPTGLQVVIKQSSKREHLSEEFSALAKLPSHENIAPFVDSTQTETSFYLATQKMGTHNLFEYLSRFGPLSENEARSLFVKVCGAVRHCHENGVVHGDLKPENIVLDPQGAPYLCDFGGAMLFGREEKNNKRKFLKARVVSVPYTGPEVRKREEVDGEALDVWSLGVILFTIVSGRTPWTKKQWELGLFHELDLTIPLSDSLLSLLRKMLKERPEKRIRLKEVQESDWVQNQTQTQNQTQNQNQKQQQSLVGFRSFSLPSFSFSKIRRFSLSPSPSSSPSFTRTTTTTTRTACSSLSVCSPSASSPQMV